MKKINQKKKNWLDEEIIQNLLIGLLAFLILLSFLGYFHQAGPVGDYLAQFFKWLFGKAYFWTILFLAFFGLVIWKEGISPITLKIISGSLVFGISILGISELFFPKKFGALGYGLSLIQKIFGFGGTLGIFFLTALMGCLIAFGREVFSFKFEIFKKRKEEVAIPERLFPQEPEIKKTESIKLKDLTKPKIKKKETKEEIFEPRKVWKIKTKWQFPSFDLLIKSKEIVETGDLKTNAYIIQKTLENFGIRVEMSEVNVGPTFTQYTLKPAEGVKLSKILSLQNDLALALAAHPIRVEAPIPGKSLVGIEVPNKKVALVRLGNLLEDEKFLKAKSLLKIPIGKTVIGERLFGDLAIMPHLLIAGATGSGKSVFIHSLLVSLLMRNSPETLNLILIDPKRVELTRYEKLPHLLTNVLTKAKKALMAIKWLIQEMERRYEILEAHGARDLESYNLAMSKQKKEILPYIILIIDELADLMVSYGKEIESAIVRLAQMSRATGIHLVLATQRPSVEVITGLIKANITNRIAFQVASQVDSRTILDSAGAEKLLGRGDALFVSPEFSKAKRIQAPFVSEEEIKRIVNFWKNSAQKLETEFEKPEIEFEEEQTDQLLEEEFPILEDELYQQAYNLVVETQKASASFLQRKLKIGYARAARLLDMLEAKGVVGPAEGSKPRKVLISKDESQTNQPSPD